MPEKKLPLIISSGWFMVLWPSISCGGQDAEKWILLVASSVQEGGWKTLFRNRFNYSL